jgi:hypothetical protein
MTVEIKELVIRATVEHGEISSVENPHGRLSDAEMKCMIDLCVKEVSRILKRSKER